MIDWLALLALAVGAALGATAMLVFLPRPATPPARPSIYGLEADAVGERSRLDLGTPRTIRFEPPSDPEDDVDIFVVFERMMPRSATFDFAEFFLRGRFLRTTRFSTPAPVVPGDIFTLTYRLNSRYMDKLSNEAPDTAGAASGQSGNLEPS